MAVGKKIEENNRTQTYPRPQRRGGGIEMAGRSNQSTGDGEGGCCTLLTYISQGGRERGEGDGDISPIRRIYSPTWLM